MMFRKYPFNDRRNLLKQMHQATVPYFDVLKNLGSLGFKFKVSNDVKNRRPAFAPSGPFFSHPSPPLFFFEGPGTLPSELAASSFDHPSTISARAAELAHAFQSWPTGY